MSTTNNVSAQYLASGDPALKDYFPAWVNDIADDATVEGSMLNGALQGADAVRSVVLTIRSLYEHQEFKFAGPCGDNGFLEDYVARVNGEPIGVHGAAGNVGACAVQLAKRVAREVIATAFPGCLAYVRALGADRVVDVQTSRFEEILTDVDVVLDTIGGDTQDRSFAGTRRQAGSTSRSSTATISPFGSATTASASMPPSSRGARTGTSG